jgi:hypothetical protein
MNLPYDICIQLIQYLTLYDLTDYRVVSKDALDHVKAFEGHDYMTDRPIKGCIQSYFKCFPNIKYVDITKTKVRDEDFELFGKVEELSLSVIDMTTDDLFQYCHNLKKMCIYSSFYRDSEYYHFIDPMFKYLKNLASLFIIRSGYITDDALFHLTHLKELYLVDCYQITSSAIRQLKHLKKLHITEQFYIDDSAFEGSQIEDLTIHHQSEFYLKTSSITDKGILQLSQLKKLDCKNVPLVRGVGFNQLKLHTLILDYIILRTDIADFDHIENLSIYNSTIQGEFPAKWKKLLRLKCYNTNFNLNHEFSNSLCKISPPLVELQFINCRINEPILRKTFKILDYRENA